jgi:hypothetical protein
MSEKEAAKEHFSALKKIRERRRWYYVKVYPRNLEEPQYQFVGKCLDHNEEETVFEDQEGRLYYLRDPKFEVDGDLVSVRSEVAESGKSPEEILEALKEIHVSGGMDFECPKILEALMYERREDF